MKQTLLSDKLFFEGELEWGLEDSATKVNLEYAHLTYLLNDYITVYPNQQTAGFSPHLQRG